MDKYIEAEMLLAKALRPDWFSYQHETMSCAHRWCRDDAAAFRLMVEHDIDVLHYPLRGKTIAHFVGPGHIRMRGESYDDHPDKSAAVRYAIVQAVIAKLEAS